MGLKVGIVRDDRFLEHKPGLTHPEHPRRLQAIYRMLDKDFKDAFVPVKAELATLEDLERVHTPAYVEKVLKTADQDFTSLAPDTPASAKTYLAAWLAVGACLKALEALRAGRCDACFCLVRPPGHHALTDRAGGFCIFNNLGITARVAMERHGLRRILIIDWDDHHGNGIQDLFYDSKEVLYFSSHDVLLYPYTGPWEATGAGEGEGYTINVPLPREVTDEDMVQIYRGVLEPLFMHYRPELVLVVAGFDAHREDPIGRGTLTEKVYSSLTRLIVSLRAETGNPPLLFALEGGYHPSSLARSVKAVLEALIQESAALDFQGPETERAAQILKKLRRIHAKYRVWI